MQSKLFQTKQASPEANGLLVGMDAQDIAYVINEYQSDNDTTVCPNCETAVGSEDLAYIVDQQQTWEDPEEGHNACPHCDVELDCSDLQKPTFEHWLKLTA